MSDFWSGLAPEQKEDGWLYKVDGVMRGPVPSDALLQKLLDGDLTLHDEIARFGGSDFHPVHRVRAFSSHVPAIRREEKKRERRKKSLAVGLVVLVAGLLIGALVWSITQKADILDKGVRADNEKILQQKDREASRRRETIDEVVDVVALRFSPKEIKVGRTKRTKTKRGLGKRGGKPSTVSSDTSKNNVSGDVSSGGSGATVTSNCRRTSGTVYSTLKRYGTQLLVCVDDEKKRSGDTMPSKLPLSLVVAPDGKIAEFSIKHRFYRTGPLNNCLTKRFRAIRFANVGGGNCPITIPLKVKK